MTELPTSFGKYYLTEKLATGGMAEIYLAKIIGPGGFEKPLVIKQILPKLSGQRHFVDLFVAEAKTLVTLTHGNIVPVYELGVIDDTYFIAMDYIDGPTLYRLTETMARREARMEPAVAAWITTRMLEGLDYAHRKGEGVIHRDLSPRNVMLSRDGEVKLVDFGIAVTLGDPGESGGAETAPTGSFPYMSPEQVRRESLTGQTDLFSVGVLAWEMLTGQRLFHRPDVEGTLSAVQRDVIPRPSSVVPEIPARLDEVVMRALERDRTVRWQTAAEMLAPLNKYLYALDETPGPRDVSALVARFCPPETRRLPTHLEAIAHDVISPEPLAHDPPSAPIPSGPSTAVIPRDQAAKGRPQRQKSFATNVDLRVILDGQDLPSFAGDSVVADSPFDEKSDVLPSFDEKSDVLPAFDEKSDLLPAFDAIEDSPTKDDRPLSPRADTPLDKPAGAFAADTVIDGAPVTPGREGPAPAARRSRPMGTVDDLPAGARRSRPMDAVDDGPGARRSRPVDAVDDGPGARRSRPMDAVDDVPGAGPPARRSRPMDTVDDSAEEAIERPIRRTPRSVQSQPGVGPTTSPPSDRSRAASQGDIGGSSRRATSHADVGAPRRARSSRGDDVDEAIAARKALADPTNVDVQPLGSVEVPKQLREPPSRAVLVLAGLGAIALGVGALAVFFQNRDRVMKMGDAGIDAPRVIDAGALDDGAMVDAPAVVAPDGGTAIIPTVAPIDAGHEHAGARDGGRHVDISSRVDAGAGDTSASKGSATLRLGADPWGDIYIDGKSMGRTPRELTVTAGHHTVEIVFPAETPPRKQTFAVDLANGETKPLQADFNR